MIAIIRKKLQKIMDNADTRMLSTQAGGILGIKIAAAGIAFLVQIPLARILGTAEYGLYAFVLSWVLIAAVFMRMGMDVALVRFVAVYGADGRYGELRAMLLKALGLTVLLNIVLCLVVFLTPAFADMNMVKAGALLLIPATMGVMLQAALRGLRRVMLAEVTEGIIRPLLMLALFVGVTGLWFGTGAYAAAVANVIAGVATVAALLLWLARHMPRETWRVKADFSAWRTWYGLALPMMLLAGLQVILYRTDIVMVGMLRDAHEAGIYAVAARMAELAGFGILAVNGIVAPLFAELHATRQAERLGRVLRLSQAWALAVAVGATVIFVAAGPFLIGLFGAGFAPAYTPLLILAAGQVAHAAGSPVLILMTMSGRQRQALVIFGICALVNLTLNFTLTGAFGMNGAAVATTATLMLYALLLTVYARRVDLAA